MIYLISDLHGSADFRGLRDYLQRRCEEDVLIILGDLGLCFEDTEENHVFTEYMLSLEKNIALVDSNHENFVYLNSFPEEQWQSGIVHRLNDRMVHLKRGQIYTLEGKRYFVFGGCKSSPKWKEMELWQAGEEASDEELAEAYANLEGCGRKVDYILTHKYEQTPPRGTVSERLRTLTAYIEKHVSYTRWYAGHWHVNEAVEYLFGLKGAKVYKVIFVVMIISGAVMTSSLAWDISDTFNGLMMIPNLIGVVALFPLVIKITANYVSRTIKGKDEAPMLSYDPEIQKEMASKLDEE